MQVTKVLEMSNRTKTALDNRVQKIDAQKEQTRRKQEAANQRATQTNAGFNSDESTNSLLNNIGLAVQRQGGHNAN